MKIPHDATVDVKTAFRELISEVETLKKQWVDLNGSRLTGAREAVTPTGLVTLNQLQRVESLLKDEIVDVQIRIDTLKLKNNLV